MIISPPFLPNRAPDIADADYIAQAMPVAAINCPGSGVPEGSFPVSLKLGWHGGTHLHAPSNNAAVLPVRAIADGEIVYARKPTTRVEDASHPLNYNPYGTSPAWTDNGLVIIRHRTDIGTGTNAEAIEFYSLSAHLSVLKGNALKVANGSGSDEDRRVCRKDELGGAGQIYSSADHIHFEILCDDANLEKLVGRATGILATNTDGRNDSVYGEVYFHIPAGAQLYSTKPGGNITSPPLPVTETTDEDLVIGIRYANGNGPATHRGSAWITTYQTNGEQLSTALEEIDADYDVYKRANEISQAYSTGNPAPSAIYELLRFGRVLSLQNETLAPADCPHWREVRGIHSTGWINLNASNVRKFSDADFPDWKGWKLIADDVNEDSRVESAQLREVIEGPNNASGSLTPDELQRRLNLPDVRSSLAKCICKFPSEWNGDSINARWGWLKTDPEYGIAGADWENLHAHITALTVPGAALPPPLASAHWHFHPQEFIKNFRSCSWLSLDEMTQTFPKYLFYTTTGNPRTAITTNTNIFTLSRATAKARIEKHQNALNMCIRKYIGANPKRIAFFLAQVTLETAQWRSGGNMCRLLHEWYYGQSSITNPATQYYTAFYGRGIMQLTWAGNYKVYGEFRSFGSHSGSYVERIPNHSPRITSTSQHFLANPNDGGTTITWSPRYDPDIIGEDAYNACDSGGFYWIFTSYSGNRNINRVCDRPYTTESAGLINRLVNGGGNGYYERQAYTAYLMRYFTDDTANSTAETITPPSPKNKITVNFART